MAGGEVSAAAAAFGAIAEGFDGRFSPWLSVASQRRSVRAALASTFPPGSRLIEIGGGTGEDALWLAERGRSVLMTDAAPAMVAVAAAKFGTREGLSADLASAERLEKLGAETVYDGAYSNFAALNCIEDLEPFARGLARLVKPGGHVLLVLFGAFCPAEMLVEALRGRPRNMFRRLRRGEVPARLAGRDFTIRYYRRSDLVRDLAPWFRLERRQGIGLLVPPSAAEPWISRHPHLLSAMEAGDGLLAGPLAGLADHILYQFVRTGAGQG